MKRWVFRIGGVFFLVFLGLLCVTAMAGAQQANGFLVTVDEDGHGTISRGGISAPLPFALGPDPGPGGLPSVLTYKLPFAGIQGDVHLTDADVGGIFLDVIRFNGDGTLIFYSDNIDGFDALADTPGPPGQPYRNLVSIPEIGPEGNNGAFYTPGPDDPGRAILGDFPVSYHFISDRVPAPPALALLGCGLAALLGLARRRHREI